MSTPCGLQRLGARDDVHHHERPDRPRALADLVRHSGALPSSNALSHAAWTADRTESSRRPVEPRAVRRLEREREDLGAAQVGEGQLARGDDLVRRLRVEAQARARRRAPTGRCPGSTCSVEDWTMPGSSADDEAQAGEEVVRVVAGQADDEVALDRDAGAPCSAATPAAKRSGSNARRQVVERGRADRLRARLDRRDARARQQRRRVVVDALDVDLDGVQPPCPRSAYGASRSGQPREPLGREVEDRVDEGERTSATAATASISAATRASQKRRIARRALALEAVAAAVRAAAVRLEVRARRRAARASPVRYGDGIVSRSSMSGRSGAETISSPSRAVTPGTIHGRRPRSERVEQLGERLLALAAHDGATRRGCRASTSSAIGPTSGPPSTMRVSGRGGADEAARVVDVRARSST